MTQPTNLTRPAGPAWHGANPKGTRPWNKVTVRCRRSGARPAWPVTLLGQR